MRPQGRSPSFFIVGLFLAVGILGFNYWSLSKRNHDLATQLLNMQDQLRLSISKRMNVERRGSNIVNELKKCETALDMDKNEVARKESEVITLTEQLKIKDVQLNSHEAKVKEVEDIRMSLKTCEENNSGIIQELQKKKEELKAFQPTGVNAETCKACKDQWTSDQKTLLDGIDHILGPTALLQLKNAGFDIGNYALDLSAQLKNTSKNMSVQPAANPAAVPAETGQNVGANVVAPGGNDILGVNSANNVNQGTNSNQNIVNSLNNKEVIAAPNSNDNKAGVVENQGAGAVENQGAGAVENQGAGAVENQGAGAVENQGAGAVENQGAGASVNNDVAGGNQGAVVNNGGGGNPVIIDAGEQRNIPPQNNDAPTGYPGVVPLLNNNINDGGVENSPNRILDAAEKLKLNDVAGGNLPPIESSNVNGAPAVPPNQPKIEPQDTKAGLLDMIKKANVLFDNQFKTAPSINNPNLLAAQDGVNVLTSINITKSGVQTPNQLSNSTTFSTNASNAVLMSPESPSDKDSSLLAVKSTKTDSSDPAPGPPQMKPVDNLNVLKYLLTNSSGPISNMKADDLKVGLNPVEDSIDKMQKSMTLDEDKMNSLEKNHS